MPAAAALTLKNAAAANVTFDVFSVEPNAVEWNEAGATSILGTSKFRVGRTIPQNKVNGVYRSFGRLTRPVVNSTTGALDGNITMAFEITRPANLSNAEVDEAYARFKEAVAQALVQTMAKSGAIPT